MTATPRPNVLPLLPALLIGTLLVAYTWTNFSVAFAAITTVGVVVTLTASLLLPVLKLRRAGSAAAPDGGEKVVSGDPFANGDTTADVFSTLVAEEAGVPVAAVRQVLTTLWGGGDLDTIAIETTVEYALDVTYNDRRRDGWPAAERIALPKGIDGGDAAWNAAVTAQADYVAAVSVVHRGIVTTTGPWKQVSG